MKNLFKNSFSLDQKKPSLARVSEKWNKLTFASQEKLLPSNFKNFNKALFSHSFHYIENPSSLAGMKDSLK